MVPEPYPVDFMSRRSFFAKRVPFFGNRAMLILCAVFFLLPFILRGARESVDGIKNDVADWLPESFEETKELKFFRDFFYGDQFVVVSWDGCNEQDPRYKLFYDKVKQESLAGEALALEMLSKMDPASPEYARLEEDIRARQWGTELGLQTTGNYFENWGEHGEKWLQGKDKQWYFIQQDGSVFKWNGQNNVIDAGRRFIHRFLNGRNKAEGTFVKQFGSPTGNRFYNDPGLLSARFFVDVTTGPDVFQLMAGENGTMRVGKFEEGSEAVFEAELETRKRLTGVLFGPTPSAEFDWSLDSFIEVIPEDFRNLIDEPRKFEFQEFVARLVEENYNGDINRLIEAPPAARLEHWYRLWDQLNLDPPPRQTCFVITLNDPVLDELARVVGRPVLGKPRGRVLELASRHCGIAPENLHIGGPPVDNVAIDEEGSITLFRLVGLSALIGITLAWVSFRSVRVTFMLFFVGGVSAISSLAIVWFLGGTLDAILMTMPSLVYVLGLSGAVHVVNYYREACHEKGEGRAADIAVKHGLFPCALAAFTTALGLGSLCTSNLTPINKFGFYSAIAVLATVIMLFTFLPAALTVWSPGYRRRDVNHVSGGFSFSDLIEKTWERIGRWVVRNNIAVAGTMLVLMVAAGFGIAKIQTSVQLLKLFRSDAKILQDYHWMETNLGKLVPMEVLVQVDGDAQIRQDELPVDLSAADLLELDLKLNLLQRMELSDRVRRYILQVFGEESTVPDRRVIGNVMSTDLTTPLKRAVTSQVGTATSRLAMNSELEHKRDALLDQDFLRVDPRSREELWRISLRLAALNDVDYGQFVGEMKTVVEPVLSAYRYRTILLRQLHELLGQRDKGRVLVLGRLPQALIEDADPDLQIGLAADGEVDQTAIFVNTLHDLMLNATFRRSNKPAETRTYSWLDPAGFNNPSEEGWKRLLSGFDAVVIIDQDERIDMDLVGKYARSLIVADDHRYEIDPENKLALDGMLTAAQRKAEGDEDSLVKASYTGIVPIVYKAQRSLLTSLIESILLAFVMIAVVMMILLRPWGSRWRAGNLFNFRAGMIAMIPNVFPIVVIFGLMGHLGREVDIGSMMTASVAMGVAVDDTIHFLNWFRQGVARGMTRLEAIALSYKRVATAMTQTTLIGGFGLSAFAFSTFMPTQRFGILMLFLLAAALIGDLILLPALLASPLGKYFCNLEPSDPLPEELDDLDDEAADAPSVASNAPERGETPVADAKATEPTGRTAKPHMLRFLGRARGRARERS